MGPRRALVPFRPAGGVGREIPDRYRSAEDESPAIDPDREQQQQRCPRRAPEQHPYRDSHGWTLALLALVDANFGRRHEIRRQLSHDLLREQLALQVALRGGL